MRDVPGIAAVNRALAYLEPTDWQAAAMHLLTPLSVVVGMQARCEANGDWTYRGYRAPAESVRQLWGLVLAGHEEGDTYLDVDSQWGSLPRLTKSVRSGAGTIVTGLRLLAGVPDAYVAKGCPEATESLVAMSIANGGTASQPIVVSGQALVMIRRGEHMLVSPAARPTPKAISAKQAALKAASHAARLRQEWGTPVDLQDLGELGELAREFSVTAEDGSRRARLTVGSALVGQTAS